MAATLHFSFFKGFYYNFSYLTHGIQDVRIYSSGMPVLMEDYALLAYNFWPLLIICSGCGICTDCKLLLLHVKLSLLICILHCWLWSLLTTCVMYVLCRI